MTFSTKDKVFFIKTPILYIEGVIVGYIEHKGKRTYRVLVDNEIFDAEEKDLISYDKEYKSTGQSA